jgi:hypothetical protein
LAAWRLISSPSSRNYFAFFHQNRERAVLGRVTGHGKKVDASNMHLGVFTDTFDEVNGVSRFVREMSRQAGVSGRDLTVATCVENAKFNVPHRKNFRPLVDRPMPMYPDLRLTLPPLLEVLDWADRQQFDAIHVDTPGPMGLCGLLVASMLRVPVIGTYHTDFPAYVMNLTRDYRLTTATAGTCGCSTRGSRRSSREAAGTRGRSGTSASTRRTSR